MAKISKREKWTLYCEERHEEISISGPNGMCLWVITDDVDHDEAQKLAQWITIALNEREP